MPRLAGLLVVLLARVAAAQPAVTSDAVLSIPDLATPERRDTESILIQLVDSTADVKERADYLFRLGTLYEKDNAVTYLKIMQSASIKGNK